MAKNNKFQCHISLKQSVGCVLLCVFVLTAVGAWGQDVLVDGALVVESGTIQAASSGSGIGQIHFVGHATQVQAQIGTGFGFRYTTSGHPDGTPIILTVAFKHPPITDPKTGETTNGQVYQLNSAIGRAEAEYFVFEKPFELVSGTYEWRIFHGKLLLTEQAFTVSGGRESSAQSSLQEPPKPAPLRSMETVFKGITTLGQSVFLNTKDGEFVLKSQKDPELFIQIVDVVSRIRSGDDITVFYREPRSKEVYGELVGIKTSFFGALGKTNISQ